jgi:hypothetical protein
MPPEIHERLCVLRARNLKAAFHMSRANFRQCVTDTNGNKLRVVVRHPLGKVTYAFNKKNSEKIKGWLWATAPQVN